MQPKFSRTAISASIDFLAFGAHPDDIELGCGGTLIRLAQQGYRTAAVTLTRGEAGTRGTPEIRQKEFTEAAKIMQVAVHRQLDIPDSAIEETHENKLKLVRVIRELRPRLVATVHWESRHPDHIHTAHLVRDAAMIAGLKNLIIEENAHGSMLEPWRPFRVFYFPERFEVHPSFVVDISATFEQKMSAVRAHESQFHGPNMEKYGTEQTSIARPEFLEFIEMKNRRWGAMIGTRYGEAFVVREAVRIDDPVSAFGEWCREAIP
ncbi:MAG: bacillithiol biosynthesis deacetylase BshB1 [candidate division KSB1 bacterium]|nr:bacillithiol biosynthesis deacetylase BshB1 [candidate division KSB1 bacterium]MDZ7302932.1 bacillithiol biosynthesis deacetylase BshB1 [candidate division KSB1 bacterium]MDZ7312208.1 bacillithiol biosynthesis deacetylase BshB1 [candidate division KSB1 bacterium]